MTQIPVTIVDAADIRSVECLLPTSVPVSRVTARLAELLHLPLLGWDGRPLAYGLIVKGGMLLDPQSTLDELNLPRPLIARLVPDITAGADEAEPQMVEPPGEDVAAAATDWDSAADECAEEPDVLICEQTALLHDAGPEGRPDLRIDVEVHRDIEAFAAENRNKECAGLLLGSVEFEGKTRIIHITAAAMAEDAVGTRASVNISLAAWESILRVRDLDYPELRVLGWFHTHAGWGVFMSDSDVFIHRHFFGHRNMVAYVLDPTTGRDGFFYWHDGRIALCPSYGLVGSASDLRPNKREQGRQKTRSRLTPGRLGLAGLVVFLGLLGYVGAPFIRRAMEPRGPALDMKATVVTTEREASGDQIYTIRSGDNPWRICNRVYGDGDLALALMGYNGLANVAGLQIGQTIKLPPKEKLRELASRL